MGFDRIFNLQPIDLSHTGGRRGIRGRDLLREDTALTPEALERGTASQLQALNRFVESNSEALRNHRRQLRLNPTNLYIISDAGRDLLFQNEMGLRQRGRAAPVFAYYPPMTNETLRRRRRGTQIRFIVAHRFSPDDARLNARPNARTIGIDPETGYNPRRFANGVQQLIDPNRTTRVRGERVPAKATVHHLLSLRGDHIRSVSWDMAANHVGPMSGGGSARNVNNLSIGIEHEGWAARTNIENRRIDSTRDWGPYSEEQFANDAFIIKKLTAYTQLDYLHYLGTDTELRQRARAGESGCFNHISISTGHTGAGVEFFLPPGFLLRQSSFASVNDENVSGKVRRWEERIAFWYPNVRTGTDISAWGRIFAKTRRLRNFNIQTELFDPTLGQGPIPLTVPSTINNTHRAAAAQLSANTRISGFERSQQMQAGTRAGFYNSAVSQNAAVATAIAEYSTSLLRVTQTSLRLPVVVNALAFDYQTGQWINATTTNSMSASEVARRAQSTTNETPEGNPASPPPPRNVPPTE
jgi:hypothetical protein